jgi:hypothetical protein
VYNSPITIFEPTQTIYEQIAKATEEYIYKAVLSQNIDVNRDELIKALRYDRDQYNKGYHDAMLEQKNEWISVKSRPMDAEERKEWSEKFGYDLSDDEAVIFVSQMPDDNQEVLVCTKWGRIYVDKFLEDPDYGVSFEENGDMDGIVAWMPLPEPPKEE